MIILIGALERKKFRMPRYKTRAILEIHSTITRKLPNTSFSSFLFLFGLSLSQDSSDSSLLHANGNAGPKDFTGTMKYKRETGCDHPVKDYVCFYGLSYLVGPATPELYDKFIHPEYQSHVSYECVKHLAHVVHHLRSRKGNEEHETRKCYCPGNE